jgi:molybdopterin-guanine dinucleotide biosynthesis protein A
MPWITAEFLVGVLHAAASSSRDCVIPVSTDGRDQPLCAAYSSRCLPAVRAALDRGDRKVLNALAMLDADRIQLAGPFFRNVNTPVEWAEVAG